MRKFTFRKRRGGKEGRKGIYTYLKKHGRIKMDIESYIQNQRICITRRDGNVVVEYTKRKRERNGVNGSYLKRD